MLVTYAEDNDNAGFYLGYNSTSSKYVFGIGDGGGETTSNKFLKWDGTNLTISGATLDAATIDANSSFAGSTSGANFLQLTDTPSSFTANKFVKVNSSGNGLEYGNGGGVVQTKSSFTQATQSTNSGSFVDCTGLSVTITPTDANNKILVIYSFCFGISSQHGGFRLMRDSTPIGNGASAGSRIPCLAYFYGYNHNEYDMERYGGNYLDSPGDTNAHTYKIQMATPHSPGNNHIMLNYQYNDTNANHTGRGSSTITVMEVLP